MDRPLSTAEVARILGLPAGRVRAWVRRGFCTPERRGRQLAFSFRDLVVLRAARDLMAKEVPAVRVHAALRELAKALPEEGHLAELSVFAEGGRVAVRDAAGAFDATTGQGLLNFSLAPLAEAVEALEDRRDAQAADPDGGAKANDAALAFQRGLALEADDPVGACRAYGEALEIDRDHVDAYVNLGRLALEAGDVRDAARLFHEALERHPSDPVVHFNLALALEDTAGAGPACAHYERALELDAGFADAHFNLAGLYEELGRGTDALRHYREYRNLVRSGGPSATR